MDIFNDTPYTLDLDFCILGPGQTAACPELTRDTVHGHCNDGSFIISPVQCDDANPANYDVTYETKSYGSLRIIRKDDLFVVLDKFAVTAASGSLPKSINFDS